MAKKRYIWIVGILLLVGILFCAISGSKVNGYDALKGFEEEIVIYKSATCGCCSIYVDYFKRQGNSNVITSEDIDLIKTKYRVPLGLESCHTTVIGDYFVEGHIPLEAINKLLEEKPEIAGIVMPGMPSGSPGMPGSKTEDFIIYAVDHNGGYEEFMRI